MSAASSRSQDEEAHQAVVSPSNARFRQFQTLNPGLTPNFVPVVVPHNSANPGTPYGPITHQGLTSGGGYLHTDRTREYTSGQPQSIYPQAFNVAGLLPNQANVRENDHPQWLNVVPDQYINYQHPTYEPQGQLVREDFGLQRPFDQRQLPQYSYTGGVADSSIQYLEAAPFEDVSPGTSAPSPSSAVATRLLSSNPTSRRASRPGPSLTDIDSANSIQPPDWQSGKPRLAGSGRMSRPSHSPQPESSDSAQNGQPEGGAQQRASIGVGKSRPHSSTTRSRAAAQAQASSNPARPTSTAQPPKHPNQSILPAEKVFPIQIGSELFRLSGAAPSYFSQFFEKQIEENEDSGGVRTLYIDRDPGTFRDISQHLQGYHVKPRDGSHFVKLFADAQFYSLPRLISQLFESEIFIQIGDQHFQIPRDIFSGPGDSPNFFSLGFAVFFSTPSEVFPGLDRKGLLRPPSILPPSVPTRSAAIFEQLLHMLRGYPLHIRNAEHRAELLRDCRYFHLRGLEQKLIPHSITYNHSRQKSQITINLSDVHKSGLSFLPDPSAKDQQPAPGWVYYSRPFVDDETHELILEISDSESSAFDLSTHRLDFRGQTKARIASLLQVIANKMNLPTQMPLGLMMMESGGARGGIPAQSHSPAHTPLSEDHVKVRIGADTDVILDSQPLSESDLVHLGLCAPSDEGADDDGESEGVGAGGPSTSQASSAFPSATASPHISQTQAHPQSQPQLYPGIPPRKRRRAAISSVASAEDLSPRAWIIRRAQYRLRVQRNPGMGLQDTAKGTGGGLEVVFAAVKIDAITGEKARNRARAFLL
ncbi:MAG: hypothetical protein Q9227_003962 [Pyrenula ochraceoflavens]